MLSFFTTMYKGFSAIWGCTEDAQRGCWISAQSPPTSFLPTSFLFWQLRQLFSLIISVSFRFSYSQVLPMHSKRIPSRAEVYFLTNHLEQYSLSL